VTSTTTPNGELTERALSRWRLIEDFKERLDQAARTVPRPATWSDPARRLQDTDYLSLFLLGLLNPVVGTMRGLCAASRLERVQREVCTRPVSLGSFSEAQAVLKPELLAEVFAQLSREIQPAAGPAERRWLIQDGSLFDALPRMYWALWRRQGRAQSQVRLHLSLDLTAATPARARITPGKHCERAVRRTQFQRGDGYVGDRYYGEDYQWFGELERAGVAFVVRLREEAALELSQELPLTAADPPARVLRDAWVQPGCRSRRCPVRVRVVWVQTDKEVLRRVTNLAPEELAAGAVALLYKQRWQIELFFRWVKCIWGCRHWLAESPAGVAIQIYLARIAARRLQAHTGQRPNRRRMELIRLYLLGVATLAELWAGLKREQTRLARRKKA
jgi:Transposase DDE domain